MSHCSSQATKDEFDRVLRPIAEATGLPNPVYTSKGHFFFERDNVIGATWAALTFADTIPNKPYARPLQFMGLPLVVIRNAEGQLNVFHNVCSHRGMVLVNEPVEYRGVIKCPYHSWTYDGSGTLKGTPHVGGVGVHKIESFRCEDHGLKKIRSTVWMGVIFINLDGKAGDFASYIAPIEARTRPFIGDDGLNEIREGISGHKMTLDVASNWKLPVENFSEAYHLPWVHPGLNSYSRLEDHYNILGGEDGFSGQGSLAYRLNDVTGASLPTFSNWPADRRNVAEYYSLYPNTLLGFQADHAWAIILTPLSEYETREELRVFYVGSGADGPSCDEARRSVLAAWAEVFKEDVFAVEGMQRGRASPGYKGGVFSPVMDQPTHHFHAWIARASLASLSRGDDNA